VIVVVSDTSPIRALHHLGLLHLLKEMYGQVLVPPAVQRELALPPEQFQRIDLTGVRYIEVRAPANALVVENFLQLLHQGESEALALALELHASAVLIDDAAGRKVAKENGIHVVGTLGILLEAKAKGYIQTVRPLIESLINELGFFVSNELEQTALRIAGE
jgi:uncharacterized protein